MKVLLTGAGGFIGSYVSELLIKKGIDILSVSKMSGQFKYSDKALRLPLSDKQGLIDIIKNFQPDAVIHMAAIASAVHDAPSEIYNVNICGTENLLEAIKSACPNGIRVILFSTAGVYGNQKLDFYKETDNVFPVNHYSSSKAIMEFLCHNYDDCMDIRIVRPFNIIGKGQSETFLVPKLVKVFQNKLPEVSLGNLAAVRDYVSVEFCAAATVEYLLCQEFNYPIMNICSGVGVSVKDIYNKLVHITGHTPEILISENIVRHNEIWHLVGDTHRINNVMQQRQSPNVESILFEMLDK